jgi:hypothetical protein
MEHSANDDKVRLTDDDLEFYEAIQISDNDSQQTSINLSHC